MTSNPECFVYITLPGQTGFTTAGKFVLETNRQGTPKGRFVYGRSYQVNVDAVPIDPIDLTSPTDPNDRTDPIDPNDSTDPIDPKMILCSY